MDVDVKSEKGRGENGANIKRLKKTGPTCVSYTLKV